MDSITSETIEKIKSQSDWRAQLGVVFLCLGLSLLVVLPFSFIGEVPMSGCCGGAMPMTHDGAMHHNQMQSFWRGLSSGQIYPRWDDQTHNGYGAPTTIFYPPGVYYLTSLLFFLLRDWQGALIAWHFVTMAASGAAIYLYARQTMSRSAGLIAMIAYLIAPYHLINQYQRGALAEQMGFIWMPLVLMFAGRVLKGSKSPLNLAGLSLSFGLFIWSHPPTAYQLILVFGLCLAVYAVWNTVLSRVSIPTKYPPQDGTPNILSIIWVICLLAFGSLLSASYFYPAIVEQYLINADDVEKTWPYHSSYVFDFSQKIYDHTGDFIARIDHLWLFGTITIVLIGIVFLISVRYFNSVELRGNIWLWLSAGLTASFLMTKYSYPIGKFIPKIEIGVFSWRMLSIMSLAVSLLAGACWQVAICRIDKQRHPAAIILVLTSLSILLASTAMSAWYVVRPMYRAEAFKPIPEHYNYATLPRGVPREAPNVEPAQSASGDGSIVIERWQPEFRQLRVELDKADQLQFRTSNFPGWTAVVDGKIAEVKTGDFGDIVIELPAGRHQVTLDFRSTPIRKISDWITIVSFAVLVLVFGFQFSVKGVADE
jgi:hypothetical protein